MSNPIYLGIDLGTQSVRAFAADSDGQVLASASQSLTSQRDGARHQQQPEEWWTTVVTCCRIVVQALNQNVARLAGLAIDATSGTILIVDHDLKPLTPTLMYDDGRAVAEADEVNLAGADLWSQLSYRMQPSWALPKLCWLTRHHALASTARLVHQNDFINARLAGHLLATDSSHSLKTGYDLIRSTWPTDIFAKLNLASTLFPEVVPPSRRIGEVCAASARQTGLPCGLPIFSGMTDGCAAQIAAGAVTPGSWNSVLGTTLVLKGVTKDLLHDPLGVVYSHRSSDGTWLPGGASSTGAGILSRDFPDADLDALNRAAAAEGPSPLVIYPLASQGERFPFAAPQARGFIAGNFVADISEERRYGGILQGVAFLERLAFDYLQQLGAGNNGTLTSTGGATRSRVWNQIRANVLQREIVIPAISEAAFGMVILVAAHESSLAEATRRMVWLRETISPNRNFSSYADQYGTFVNELAARGWLPPATAASALQGVTV